MANRRSPGRESTLPYRFLARLIAIAPGEWVLKGGLALDYRIGGQARTTVDVDLLHAPDMARVTEVFRTAESLDLGEFFRFVTQRTNKLDRLVDGSAVRYHIRADLDGRRFEEFVVDVGFDQPGPFQPEPMEREGFLAFADIVSPPVPTLPIEVHLAEKVHAYARIYSGGNSTRVKDLIDIVLIGTTQALSANRCRLALQHTFASRRVHALPTRLDAPPTVWTAPYRTLAASVSLDPDIAAGHAFAASLLDPLLGGGLAGMAIWNPESGEWRMT